MTPTDVASGPAAPPGQAEPVRVSGRPGWDQHPGVRTGRRLRRGERTADRIARTTGSWPLLIMIAAVIIAGVVVALLPGNHALLAVGLPAAALVEVSLLLLAVWRAERIAVELALYHLDQARRAAAVTEELRAQMDRLHAEIARVSALAEKVSRTTHRP